MIIFLDFDGVIITGRANMPKSKPGRAGWNPDLEAIDALNYLISHFDGAKIVVSSSWRIEGLKKMQEYLKEWGVKTAVIDVTPFGGFNRNRGHEINLWITRNEYEGDYIVLDDDSFDLGSIPPEKFLHVDNGWEEAGLTTKMVDNFLHWRNKDGI